MYRANRKGELMNNLTLIDLDLPSTAVETATTREIEQALKYTEWSWYDVMTAFREIGYEPTQAEELRIKRALFTKKYNHLMKG